MACRRWSLCGTLSRLLLLARGVCCFFKWHLFALLQVTLPIFYCTWRPPFLDLSTQVSGRLTHPQPEVQPWNKSRQIRASHHLATGNSGQTPDPWKVTQNQGALILGSWLERLGERRESFSEVAKCIGKAVWSFCRALSPGAYCLYGTQPNKSDLGHSRRNTILISQANSVTMRIKTQLYSGGKDTPFSQHNILSIYQQTFKLNRDFLLHRHPVM